MSKRWVVVQTPDSRAYGVLMVEELGRLRSPNRKELEAMARIGMATRLALEER